MQQHTSPHAIPDDALEPQVPSVPTAEPTRGGPFGDLSYRQAQALAVTITALFLIVVVVVCNVVASAL
jgi:hypothetical protein